ncbi:MAG TPA: biotin--[acetyl-CoA-carboxylase] ligase [Firmicutes bacterium]|nr:biotin--[acetyl-CoA-carboxylase] ligase [Bacillota bacterium]
MAIASDKLKFTFISVEETTSTNDLARQFARQGPEGLVITAKRQTRGRGRRGRSWYSEPGGLYFSILLKPTLPPGEAAKITLAAGVAIVEVLQKLYSLPAELKWPNDVLVSGKKIAGILCERLAHSANASSVIVGIGINTNQTISGLPKQLQATAGSIRSLAGTEVDHDFLLKQILTRFDHYYHRLLSGNASQVLDLAKHYTTLFGRTVKVVTETEVFTAKACGISEQGALVIEKTDGSRHELWAADVSIQTVIDPTIDQER